MSEQKDENRVVQRAKLDSSFTGLVEEDERKVFTGLIPEEHFFNDYVEERFKDIMEEQMEMIRLLKKHGMPKYMANRILIVFDDLVGSSLFAGSRGSYFKGINTRHRHYSSSFLMVTQGKFLLIFGYKEVRLNTSTRT